MNNPVDIWTNPLDRFFEDWSNAWPSKALARTARVLSPKCEVTEDKSGFLFKFELPGIPKENIKIDLENNRLTVSGERKEEKKDESKDHKTHFSEMTYGSFMRVFTLPGPVDSEKVSATFDHGILSISVAKADTAKARQIQIR